MDAFTGHPWAVLVATAALAAIVLAVVARRAGRRRAGSDRASAAASPRSLAEAFLAVRRIALVGVSRNRADFSRHLMTDLARRGYEVVPVNPCAEDIDGVRCLPSVAAISPPVEAVLVLTPASSSEHVVRDALRCGVRHVWLHRGAGAGSASPGALAACQTAGVRPVIGLCPYMVLPGAGGVHRLHGSFRRWSAAAAR